MSLLHIQDLSVQFHDRHAVGETLSHLSFDIAEGEIVGIVGESGSGKSTAMQAIMGLLPERAEVKCHEMTLDGVDLKPPLYQNGKPDRKIRREYEKKMERIRGSQIAMVFQNPSAYLNPTVKVERQITETLHAHKKLTRAQAKERAIELLDLVGIRDSKKRLGQYPFELSGGLCQRVAIAIAVACEPKLLIADEPTTALDVTVQSQILKLLCRIAEETKTAMLLVSHDMGVIASVCTRVIVMRDGMAVESGAVEELFYEPEKEYTKALITKAQNLSAFSEKMQAGAALLLAEEVCKSYQSHPAGEGILKTQAVNAVSLEIHKGETYGLVGESGCGKTTLAELISGVQRPDKGHIKYQGKPLTGMRQDIQMVFQDPYASLNPRMTILETLEEPFLLHTSDSRDEQRMQIEKMLCMVGLLPEDLNKYPYAFSGGERQCIGIARALMQKPGLVVCDEPVSALDVSIQEQILELLESIQRELGNSCLFISHDLNVVKRVSQRIGIMFAGSIVEEGITRKIYTDPWHPYTKALLSAVLPADPKTARKRRGQAVSGESQNVIPKGGCPYAPRCRYAMEACYKARPQMYCFGERKVACFLYSKEHTKGRHGCKMTSQI